jgi:hypothetical protein
MMASWERLIFPWLRRCPLCLFFYGRLQGCALFAFCLIDHHHHSGHALWWCGADFWSQKANFCQTFCILTVCAVGCSFSLPGMAQWPPINELYLFCLVHEMNLCLSCADFSVLQQEVNELTISLLLRGVEEGISSGSGAWTGSKVSQQGSGGPWLWATRQWRQAAFGKQRVGGGGSICRWRSEGRQGMMVLLLIVRQGG